MIWDAYHPVQSDNNQNLTFCTLFTFLTTGSTQGLLLSSLYAPTPRLILSANVSVLYAAVNLKILGLW